MLLKIIIGVLALALGVWLGLPGRYDQTLEDIEQNMDLGASQSRKVKRVFTPMAWMQRNLKPGGSRRQRTARQPFRLEAPEDR